ncbi:MAG: hypothetical protein J0L73_09400 [Verrucomicrobia bacterium]|nr:hypothetical protein [Verrucomicrobiota bacterium]
MGLHLALAAIAFSSLLTLHAQEAAHSSSREEVPVGGRVIKLPAPVGYERIDGLNPESDRMVEEMLPATNRYLARFHPPKNDQPDMGRSFNAQVLRKVESQEIGERTFGDIKQQTKAEIEKSQESIRQDISKISGRAEKAFQKATDADAALSLSDVAILGCFDDSANSLGFTMALNIAAKAGTQSTKNKVVVSSMIVPVNGRLIYLNANADFHSEADRAWAEKAVTSWRDAVVAANPRVEGPSAGGLDFTRIGRSGVIGAVIGGVVALVAMLLKKKKQA